MCQSPNTYKGKWKRKQHQKKSTASIDKEISLILIENEKKKKKKSERNLNRCEGNLLDFFSVSFHKSLVKFFVWIRLCVARASFYTLTINSKRDNLSLIYPNAHIHSVCTFSFFFYASSINEWSIPWNRFSRNIEKYKSHRLMRLFVVCVRSS